MEKKYHCQICERDIKAKTGVIAHHGYKRPGDGWQTASCFGARRQAVELGCDAMQPYIDWLKRWIEQQQTFLTKWKAEPPAQITRFRTYGTKEVRDRPDDFNSAEKSHKSTWMNTYEHLYWSKVTETEMQITSARHEVNRIEKKLKEWKPAE